MIAAFLRKAITERDNATPCPVRIGWIGAGAIYHVAAAWMVFGQHAAIDIAVLGQYVDHMVKLVLTGGAAIGAKSILKADADQAPPT